MKLLFFIKALLKIIFLIFLFLITLGAGSSYAYAYFDEEKQTDIVKDYPIILNNFYSDTEENIDLLNQMNNFISSLPAEISNTLFDKWKFIIADKMPHEFQKYMYSAKKEIDETQTGTTQKSGYSNWRTRVVFIQADSDLEKVFSIFIHELGHCIDMEFGSISSSDEFEKIYSNNKDTYIETNSFTTQEYAASSQTEFFATAFKDYVLYPEDLQQQAPLVYNFIDTAYIKIETNDSIIKPHNYYLTSAIIILIDEIKNL